MACFRYIHMFIFLALMVIPEIQTTEGRQLKEIKDHVFTFVKIDKGLHNHAMKVIKGEQSPGIHKDDLQVSGQKHIYTPAVQTESHELSSSKVSHSTDFRPTTPGNSPGVGHLFAGGKDRMRPKVQNLTSFKGNADDFRPTVPGHSPGIGHSFGNVNAGPNA